MSDEPKKKATPAAAQIINVGFAHPVAIAGQSMESWQRDRANCKGTECAIEGNWCVITHRLGRSRVPLTNVAYVLEVQS